MPEYVRVVTFEADEAAIDALANEIKSAETPPEGLPATSVTVLGDRAGGKARVVTRFGSEDDLRKGDEILNAMTPPANVGNIRRVSVESYEVLVERKA